MLYPVHHDSQAYWKCNNRVVSLTLNPMKFHMFIQLKCIIGNHSEYAIFIVRHFLFEKRIFLSQKIGN